MDVSSHDDAISEELHYSLGNPDRRNRLPDGFLRCPAAKPGLPAGAAERAKTSAFDHEFSGRERNRLTAYKEVLEKEPVTKNERAVEVVRRVGKRIADVANQPDFQWEFNVIESETQNAFCLPGGKVAVYTGILPVCENEAGLAVVMSHEIAHAIARHGGERMNQQMITNGLKNGGTYLLNKNKVSEQKQQILLAAYGQAAQYGYILPYSRKHELEADAIGIKLMAKAGYDPSEAPVFWERFASKKEGSAPAEWMSTHPADATRAAALRELLPAAVKEYDSASEKIGLGEALMLTGKQ